MPLGAKNLRPAAVSNGVGERESHVDGYRLRYLQAGDGPPLVLLHGLLGYSFSWRFNIPVLSRSHTVYAPDVIGMGFSERPAQLDYSLRACSDRVVKWIDQLGLDSLNLVGTSHGGGMACMVAAAAAERGSPRVNRLVLVDAINHWSRGGRKRIAVLSRWLGAAVFRWTFPYTRRYHGFFLRRMYGDPAKVTQATLNGYAAGLAQPYSCDYGLGVVRTWRQDLAQLRETYAHLRGIPTQLIWGERDPAVPLPSARELQKALPGSELVVLPAIGHLPYEEAPEDFNRILLDFLARPVS
ncbi:MAG: alpha/beta fold hydrolase [Terriglobales bacterium]